LSIVLLILSLSWDQAFALDGAPARLYYRATYQDHAGAEHEVKVWRDGNRLRRDTDGRLALYVERRAGDDDRYRVIDRKKGVAYRVSRVNLYRIGSFPDWAGLQSMLVRPRNAGEVAPAEKVERTRAGECRWFEADDRRVCWSKRWRLPLRIVAHDQAGRWRQVLAIDEVSAGKISESTFVPKTDGLVDVDVDRDVHPSQD
jgi:hypothetical protein